MSDIDEISQLITDCENRESFLSSWEREYIQSLSEQLGIKPFSEKQIATLERIWEKVTA